MKIHNTLLKLILLIFFSTPVVLNAQENVEAIQRTVRQQDSLFWKGYNGCDSALQSSLIADDIEFYHDKGGITLGKAAMLKSIKNLCNGDFRLRRKAIDSTVKLHLLRANDTVYGALFTGEHVFYLTPKGKPERLDGHAPFANLWLLRNNQWKLSRVFSYDHGPAKYINERKPITLSKNQLQQLTGDYKGSQTGNMIVDVDGDHLKLTIGEKTYSIYPENDTSFFMKERDLTFSFKKKSGTKGELIIREYGETVEAADKLEPK